MLHKSNTLHPLVQTILEDVTSGSRNESIREIYKQLIRYCEDHRLWAACRFLLEAQGLTDERRSKHPELREKDLISAHIMMLAYLINTDQVEDFLEKYDMQQSRCKSLLTAVVRRRLIHGR